MFILIDFSNLLSISYFTSPFILTWLDPVALVQDAQAARAVKQVETEEEARRSMAW